MSNDVHNPLQHPEVQTASSARYAAAFTVALGLMAVSCVLTLGGGLSSLALLIALLAIGTVAVLAQLYLLFKLDLHPERRWHTISLVLTMPLLFIAITLTAWMFHTLALRTTLGG